MKKNTQSTFVSSASTSTSTISDDSRNDGMSFYSTIESLRSRTSPISLYLSAEIKANEEYFNSVNQKKNSTKMGRRKGLEDSQHSYNKSSTDLLDKSSLDLLVLKSPSWPALPSNHSLDERHSMTLKHERLLAHEQHRKLHSDNNIKSKWLIIQKHLHTDLGTDSGFFRGWEPLSSKTSMDLSDESEEMDDIEFIVAKDEISKVEVERKISGSGILKTETSLKKVRYSLPEYHHWKSGETVNIPQPSEKVGVSSTYITDAEFESEYPTKQHCFEFFYTKTRSYIQSQSLERSSVLMTCYNCRNMVHTSVDHISSTKTHILAAVLVPVGLCWLPYKLVCCRTVRHTCPICKAYLGIRRIGCRTKHKNSDNLDWG